MNATRRSVSWGGVALLACGMAAVSLGCAEVSQEVLDAAKHASTEFLIGPEDVLEVMVWRNTDLTRDVIVRPDGMISMPLIGEVHASGLTADQLAKRIAERLKKFKDQPMVSVHVKQVNSYVLYVLGEVARPNKYQLKSYTTVLQAIAMAGGFTPYASKNSMQVVRHTTNGDGESREIHIPVRYDDLLAGTGKPGNFVLQAGDIVVVP